MAMKGPKAKNEMEVLTRITGSATSVFKLKGMMEPREFAKIRNLFVGSGFVVFGGLAIAGAGAFFMKQRQPGK
eukprot:CAMPEP_0185263752 /NCGR_PEP_ID=MMETSP1359-20130426/16249_1 /TAXON_ID=552665 /ORGANISM="Bigelowiella longifila, Strain CCMP242" /LENGTH=72 /DNA_ID=CAMNT_0027851517 /DNA_START=75 /DNA_END=293 /DNA_ORIENTATION=-